MNITHANNVMSWPRFIGLLQGGGSSTSGGGGSVAAPVAQASAPEELFAKGAKVIQATLGSDGKPYFTPYNSLADAYTAVQQLTGIKLKNASELKQLIDEGKLEGWQVAL